MQFDDLSQIVKALASGAAYGEVVYRCREMIKMNPTYQKIAYGIFKNIRNRIRKLNRDELLVALFGMLNHPEATSVDRMPYYEIWHLLLLVKWTIMHGSDSNLRVFKPVTDYEVNELMNRTKNLGDYVSGLSSVQEAELFLRSSSYQQFWTQRKESIPMGFSRQLLLFGDLNPDHPYSITFQEITQIPINDFIVLSYSLFLLSVRRSQASRKTLYVTADDFSTFQASLGRDSILSFLNSISATLDELRTYLDHHSRYYGNIAQEYFEQSPLMRYPLIKIQQRYYVIADILLQTALSTFVADVLREYNAQWFMNDFGPMFESLVADSLSSSGLKFIREDDFRQHFKEGEGQKYVDLLVFRRRMQCLY